MWADLDRKAEAIRTSPQVNPIQLDLFSSDAPATNLPSSNRLINH